MGNSCSIIDHCASNPCQNNGSCASESDGYICHCHAGYDGKNCELDMDECAFNLCPARSVCYNNAGGFACVWEDNRRKRSLLNGVYLFLHISINHLFRETIFMTSQCKLQIKRKCK